MKAPDTKQQKPSMATDKQVLVEKFTKMQNDLLYEFISKDQQLDVTKLIQKRIQQLLNPKITECKGYRIMPPFSAEIVEWQYDNWNPTGNDVLVAAFPKTGTTWTTQIVKNVIYRDDEKMMELTKTVTSHHSYLDMGTQEEDSENSSSGSSHQHGAT
ncbi:unnamed protein product [Clavelina lepadiformis]|uniref:Sulfotransferase n=1 Tax=Clavelina lepadiformis TaxID=159417 RepID=A0ABP0FRB4_CLALP